MKRSVMERLDAVAAALEGVRLCKAVKGAEKYVEMIRRCRLLVDAKLRFETAGDGPAPLVVAVAGGTNVGKSSLVNWLAGKGAAAVTATARGTKTPLVTGSGDAIRSATGRWERTGTAFRIANDVAESQESFDPPILLVREQPGFPHPGLILIDSPDFDSNHLANHVAAEWMIALSDAVIVVVTPEKYNDEAVVNRIVRTRSMGRKILAVFNKMDGDDEVLEDFRSLSLTDRDGLIVFQRYRAGTRPDEDAVTKLKTRVFSGIGRNGGLKRPALGATLEELESNMKAIAGRLREEERILREPLRALERAVDATCDRYMEDVKNTEKFIELDHVVRLLLRRFDAPVIDAAANALRKRLKPMFDLLRRQFGSGPDDASLESAKRREREARRLAIAWNGLESYVLSGFIEDAPGNLREAVAEWVDGWREAAPGPDADAWNGTVETRIREWVNREVDAICEKLRDHPFGFEVLKYAKMLLQIGFGIIGAIATGGWGWTDLIVLPLTERIGHLMINLGLDRVYFIAMRDRLLRDRGCWLRGMLLERLEPLRRRLQIPCGTDYADLESLVATLPETEEICR